MGDRQGLMLLQGAIRAKDLTTGEAEFMGLFGFRYAGYGSLLALRVVAITKRNEKIKRIK
jgi:hypothetical protein